MDTHAYTSRILFVGGGTGGHFYPLIAIAEVLNTIPNGPKLYFAGPDAYDKASLDAEHIAYVSIGAGKQRRYASILNVIDIFKTAWGVVVALIKLFVLYPDVVMSKGGYTSVPVILVSAFLRIPIIVHESDAVMGKANTLGSKFARHIITTYPKASATGPTTEEHTFGIPIRKVLRTPPLNNTVISMSIPEDRPVILIIGGSQGAERINQLILDSLDELLVDFVVVHQTGARNFDACTFSADTLIPDATVRKNYIPVPFLDAQSLNDLYHRAQLVISRAGSNSIYEIALHGKPAILIPIPEEISHDQRTNAYAYAREGGAVVMEESNLTDGLLRAEIDRIMQDSELYAGMVQGAQSFAKLDSAERTAELIMGIVEEHKS